MRIFVTGAQGQLARCLADAAGETRSVSLMFGARPEFDLAQADAACDAVVRARPDVIINAAAYTAVDKAESETELAFAVNARGAEAMAQAAALLNVPLIHVSTDYVFDGQKTSAYVESDAVGPIGAYGASKLKGEELVRMAHQKHVIFRTAWVYSVYGANFVKTMLRVGRERPELKIVNDQIGNPTSAHDLARALTAVGLQLAEGKHHFGTFHLAGTGDVTWFGFAQHIFAVAERTGFKVPRLVPITTAEYPTPAKRPANSRLDCGAAEAAYGVRLPHWTKSTESCVMGLLGETHIVAAQ